jgi:hypothetical protein
MQRNHPASACPIAHPGSAGILPRLFKGLEAISKAKSDIF